MLMTKPGTHAAAARVAPRVGPKRSGLAKHAAQHAAPAKKQLKSSATPARGRPATRATASLGASRSHRGTSPPPRGTSPPPTEVSLGGKLRAVAQIFFPPRVKSSSRQAVKDRLSCVLTLDRTTLLPDEALSIEERVQQVMEQYVELHEGFNGADFHAPKLDSRVDETSGSQVFSLTYRVKRTRVGTDSGLRERGAAAEWDNALRV